MSELERNIYDCLKMFGPCTVHTIQVKLDLRGIEVNQLTVLNTAEFMVKSKLIREATGFNDHAYKV